MLTIRVSGTSLKKARTALGWSLQELAARSGVNWLTIKKYEGAGEYLPPATVGTLNRLVDALEDAGEGDSAGGALASVLWKHSTEGRTPDAVDPQIKRKISYISGPGARVLSGG
jgi:transcriptional regulator with XRE-family HTH domain